MQNVRLVTTQSFNEGSLDTRVTVIDRHSRENSMETYAFTSAVRGYHVYQDVSKTLIG